MKKLFRIVVRLALTVGAIFVGAFIVIAVVSSVHGRLSGTAAAAPSAKATAAPARTMTEIGRWSGSGPKETQTFITTNREWLLRWHAVGERGFFAVRVHDADTGRVVSLAASGGPGQDVTYVRTRPGRYYLKINAANVDWGVDITEVR